MTQVKLRVEDLTKSYGQEVAVDGLSTELRAGNLKALLGPSGCGKTTTLRCVAGLEKPDSGRIYIDDTLVSAPEEDVHVAPADRGIGMVFQSYAVWPHMTVEQNVRYPLTSQRIGSRAERKERTMEALERVGLDDYSANLATNLSGGQQQRVAIARALVTEPEIILFDEPLSNLDAKLRRDMRLEIKQLYEELGTTVLYVTHSQDEAMYLSDQLAIMLDGNIVEEGEPIRLHAEPETFFGMNFMGQCNTISGRVATHPGDDAVIETAIGEFTVDNADSATTAGTNVYVCFRPKHCRMLTANDEANAEDIVMGGELAVTAATRDYIEYRIRVNDANVLVRATDPSDIAEGDQVRFAVAPEYVKIFSRDEGEQIIAAGQVNTADAVIETPQSH